MFGAAQAMSERDEMVVSVSIRNRWARFMTSSGLDGCEELITEGKTMTTEESVDSARTLAGLVTKARHASVSEQSLPGEGY